MNPNDLAISYRSNSIVSLERRLHFSTMAATKNINDTSSSSSSSHSEKSTTNNNNQTKQEKKKDDDSNIFLDNLGKIFLSSIGIVLLLLLRSTKSNNSRVALREEMEHAALLDPLEIEDLRCANSDFDVHVWNAIVEEIKNEFVARGVGSMTYPQFLSVVVRVMKDVKGEGFTVQMGHLLDRVVIAELARRRREGNDDGQEGSDELSLSFLLASLSLALNSSVADRIRVLYDSMLIGNEMNSSSSPSLSLSEDEQSSSNNNSNNNNNNNASKEQVEDMIQNLQSTCQLVPDAQIVETNSKVPYQTFRVGTGSELTRRAREGYGGKKGSVGVTRDPDGAVTLEDFHAILKSRTVCAWGECYIKKSSKTSTSDR